MFSVICLLSILFQKGMVETHFCCVILVWSILKRYTIFLLKKTNEPECSCNELYVRPDWVYNAPISLLSILSVTSLDIRSVSLFGQIIRPSFSMLFVLICIVRRNSGMFDNDNSQPLEVCTALNLMLILKCYQKFKLSVQGTNGIYFMFAVIETFCLLEVEVKGDQSNTLLLRTKQSFYTD